MAARKNSRAARQCSEDDQGPRPNFDPAVAEQLTMLTLTMAQQSMQLNAMLDRNLVANASNVLTLGVQQINAAGLAQLTKISPMEAASTSQLIAMQQADQFAALAAARGIPGARTA